MFKRTAMLGHPASRTKTHETPWNRVAILVSSSYIANLLSIYRFNKLIVVDVIVEVFNLLLCIYWLIRAFPDSVP